MVCKQAISLRDQLAQKLRKDSLNDFLNADAIKIAIIIARLTVCYYLLPAAAAVLPPFDRLRAGFSTACSVVEFFRQPPADISQ
jgi:hypothetical protein